MRFLMLGALAACDGGETATEFHPTLAFLSPTDGATVAAGDVEVSIVVEDFELTAPEAMSRTAPMRPALPLLWLADDARAHDEEGMPAGYCMLHLDGPMVANLDTTTYTLTDVAPGEHELTGMLMYVDGDPLDIETTITFTAE